MNSTLVAADVRRLIPPRNKVRASSRRLLRCLASGALLILAPFCRAEDQRPPAVSPSKPNFVIILAHDIGRDWISCYGADHQTPNLDRIAAEGIRYETAWSMLDGELSHRTLIFGRYPSRIEPGQPHFIKLLVAAGYHRENFDFDRDFRLPQGRPYLLLCQLPPAIGDFAAHVTEMDALVGKLARATADKNTFLLFTSRAGSAVSGKLHDKNYPVGKSARADWGAHVPFFVRAPFLGKGSRVSRDLIDFTDLLPTLLELTGIDHPAKFGMDGISMVPSLRGSDDPFEKRNWIASVSTDFRMAHDWHHILDTNGRFHDLDKDPLQERKVSVQDKQAPHRKQRLQMILDRLSKPASAAK